MTTEARENLPGPVIRHAPDFWKGEEGRERIRQEALEVFRSAGKLKYETMSEAGKPYLRTAVIKRYPGALTGLKEDLGIAVTKRPNGFWTVERIEADVTDFCQGGSRLTQKLLVKADRRDLERAIANHYPGGLRALKNNLGIESDNKPIGYWNEETIEQEAREFLSQVGQITLDRLEEIGRNDLSVAIQKKYSGGITQLRVRLGLKHPQNPKGFWTPERIEEEARRFLLQSDKITSRILADAKRFDLINAVTQYYPDRWVGLRTKLGISQAESRIDPDEANAKLERLLEV